MAPAIAPTYSQMHAATEVALPLSQQLQHAPAPLLRLFLPMLHKVAQVFRDGDFA